MATINYTSTDINEYWEQYPGLSELFYGMAEVEIWVLENDVDAEMKINEWIMRLDSTNKIAKLNAYSESLIVLLYFMHSSTAMYLYKKLTDINPSIDRSLQLSANAMLKEPTKYKYGVVFWDRFKQLLLDDSLKNLFSEDRIAVIQKCIAYVSKTNGNLKND